MSPKRLQSEAPPPQVRALLRTTALPITSPNRQWSIASSLSLVRVHYPWFKWATQVIADTCRFHHPRRYHKAVAHLPDHRHIAEQMDIEINPVLAGGPDPTLWFPQTTNSHPT